MIRTIAVLIMLFTVTMLTAQERSLPHYPVSGAYYNPFYTNAGIQSYNDQREAGQLKKPDVGVVLGTSFTSDLKNGFSFSTFAAPEIKYRTSKRFTLRGGISLANTEYHNSLMYSPAGIGTFSGNITQGMVYVSGDYMLSPRVLLSGTVYKEFYIDHRGNRDMLNPAYDGKGLMMNVRFMPSDHVTIDAGVEFYQGNNPYRTYYSNPFYRPFAPIW